MTTPSRITLDDFEVDFNLSSILEQGGQSQVYIVRDSKQKLYVAKVLEQEDLDQIESNFVNEVQALQALNTNQNIIKMKKYNEEGLFCEDLAQKYIKPYIILEYCQFGNLLQLLQQQKLSEPTSRFIFLKMLEGLNFCHNNKIYHLDIKPENILIKGKNGKCQIKICDFGLSINDEICYENRGTKGFKNPQMLLGEWSYGIQADMFGLGIVLFNMIMGVMPFQEASYQDYWYYILIQNPSQFWIQMNQEVSESFKNLVQSMLMFDPSKRQSQYEQIIAHDWLKGYISTEEEALEEIIRIKYGI